MASDTLGCLSSFFIGRCRVFGLILPWTTFCWCSSSNALSCITDFVPSGSQLNGVSACRKSSTAGETLPTVMLNGLPEGSTGTSCWRWSHSQTRLSSAHGYLANFMPYCSEASPAAVWMCIRNVRCNLSEMLLFSTIFSRQLQCLRMSWPKA